MSSFSKNYRLKQLHLSFIYQKQKNQNKTQKIARREIALNRVVTRRRADAKEASPPYRLRKTTPSTAEGIAARITRISLHNSGKLNVTAQKLASIGLKNSFSKTTMRRGISITRIRGFLNIKPTDKIATGVNAAAKTELN